MLYRVENDTYMSIGIGDTGLAIASYELVSVPGYQPSDPPFFWEDQRAGTETTYLHPPRDRYSHVPTYIHIRVLLVVALAICVIFRVAYVHPPRDRYSPVPTYVHIRVLLVVA